MEQIKEQSLGNFIWNHEKMEFLGRTGSSWLKILVFYLIFYFFLACFMGAMMYVHMMTISNDRPKYTINDGLLRNPSLSIRPYSGRNFASNRIRFRQDEFSSAVYYIESLSRFIEPYKEQSRRTGPTSNVMNCFHGDGYPPFYDRICIFKHTYLGDCTSSDHWGYVSGQPCIILKFNKIFDWVPEPYRHLHDLPDEMPQHLKKVIKSMTVDGNITHMIWVSCKGLNQADKEYFIDVEYYPQPGFPAYYYPFVNKPGYLQPLVAIKLKGLPTNVLIAMECRAWARNIVQDRRRKLGLVQFEILIEEF